jgi:predicted ATPase
MIEMLTSGDPEAREMAQQAAMARVQFQDMVDELFSETGKKIVRTSNEIQLEQYGEILSPYKLSSGEKQILVILLTVLVQDRQPYVLFMDEPEISLHVEWQQKLINLIMRVNPNVQIILTTHSPALIMNGWMDAVTEVTDITK